MHPLLIFPESPKFDARINDIARMLTLAEKDYRPIGHIVGYVLRKKELSHSNTEMDKSKAKRCDNGEK